MLIDETTIDDVKIAQDGALGVHTGHTNEDRLVRAHGKVEDMNWIGSNDRMRPLIERNRCIYRVVESIVLK